MKAIKHEEKHRQLETDLLKQLPNCLERVV